MLFILLIVALSFPRVSAGKIESSNYTDPLICASCHPEIYAQWRGSMHSNSEKDPFYKKLFLLASKETNGLVDTFCPRCHAPVGLVSGEIPPADGSNLSLIAKKGLICDFCHTISGYTGEVNGQYITSPGMVKRGSLKDSSSPYHESAYSELHTKAEFCGYCHDIDHPVSGMPLETTYREWKEGPYSKAGIQCQDCHMRQSPGTPSTGSTQRPNNPGKACTIGPERDNIFTHYFIGGNAFITDELRAPLHRDMAIERLQNCASLDIEVPATVKPNEEVAINILVTNNGAGHKIPTGLTDEREVWVEVTATDEEGRVIYRSGFLDEEGAIEPDAVIYRTVLGDAEGKPTHKFWKATHVISDYRIPPRETLVEGYDFKIPKNAKGPIKIEAKLNYRSAPQETIDLLFGKGVVEVPIIEMSKKEATVELEGGMGFSAIIILVIILLAVLGIIKLRKK
ncbi:MAG: multiheme c-type cytochrome [Candidatus Zixiibacteriota bacterium]